MGRSNARCDHFGWDARLESVKVFGEFVLALDQCVPRSGDLGVLGRVSESAVTIAAAVASIFSGVNSFESHWSLSDPSGGGPVKTGERPRR